MQYPKIATNIKAKITMAAAPAPPSLTGVTMVSLSRTSTIKSSSGSTRRSEMRSM
jgi:hypothetical protein